MPGVLAVSPLFGGVAVWRPAAVSASMLSMSAYGRFWAWVWLPAPVTIVSSLFSSHEPLSDKTLPPPPALSDFWSSPELDDDDDDEEDDDDESFGVDLNSYTSSTSLVLSALALMLAALAVADVLPCWLDAFVPDDRVPALPD